jgi:hypothetical protein
MNIHFIEKSWAKMIGGLVALAFFASTPAIVYAETSKGQSGQATMSSLKSSSDAEIKHRLLGYWESPRHGYLIKSDGIIYMCPRKYCTTTNTWDVKNGTFYWDSLPNEIISLTEKKFVYREEQGYHATYTLIRITAKEAEGN